MFPLDMLWPMAPRICDPAQSRGDMQIMPEGRKSEEDGMIFPRPKDIALEPETVRVTREGRELCNLMTAAGKAEYRRRILAMLQRQGGRCCLCLKMLKPERATFEHEAGRGMAGGHRDDRIVLPGGVWINGAACWRCNSLKGSRRISYNRG